MWRKYHAYRGHSNAIIIANSRSGRFLRRILQVEYGYDNSKWIYTLNKHLAKPTGDEGCITSSIFPDKELETFIRTAAKITGKPAKNDVVAGANLIKRLRRHIYGLGADFDDYKTCTARYAGTLKQSTSIQLHCHIAVGDAEAWIINTFCSEW